MANSEWRMVNPLFATRYSPFASPHSNAIPPNIRTG